MNYTPPAIAILKSKTFDVWFAALRDRRAKASILARIDRLARGNPGDVRPVGSGVSEMRIDHGPGYRVYFTRRGSVVALLLCGYLTVRAISLHNVDYFLYHQPVAGVTMSAAIELFGVLLLTVVAARSWLDVQAPNGPAPG